MQYAHISQQVQRAGMRSRNRNALARARIRGRHARCSKLSFRSSPITPAIKLDEIWEANVLRIAIRCDDQTFIFVRIIFVSGFVFAEEDLQILQKFE